jgi:hypothetical protein
LLSTALVAPPEKLSFALLQVAVCCITTTCTKGRASFRIREFPTPHSSQGRGLNGPPARQPRFTYSLNMALPSVSLDPAPRLGLGLFGAGALEES